MAGEEKRGRFFASILNQGKKPLAAIHQRPPPSHTTIIKDSQLRRSLATGRYRILLPPLCHLNPHLLRRRKASTIPPPRERPLRRRKKKTLLATLEPGRRKKRKRGRREWHYLLLHRKPEKKGERRGSTHAMKDPRSPPRATIEGQNTPKSHFHSATILAAMRPLSLLESQNILAPQTGWSARRKRGEAGCSAGSDRRCKRHGQGAAPGRLLVEGTHGRIEHTPE
ncbi:hypothetical protein V8G54_009369 [Vigna mungo]|uniref:Uncharacterized protein n=1 Tax=Vigna mungo TaxID=3915 RepID=A0AAQ3NX24_VIGMU